MSSVAQEMLCVLEMFQDFNGNYQHSDLADIYTRIRRTLPSIYEDKYLHSVPDISLECDETIDNWDDVETGIYTSTRDEKLPTSERDVVKVDDNDISEFYADYPPPNSPVAGTEVMQDVLLLENHYVNSLLQLWRDSQQSSGCSTEPLSEPEECESQSLTSDDVVSSQGGLSLHSDDHSSQNTQESSSNVSQLSNQDQECESYLTSLKNPNQQMSNTYQELEAQDLQTNDNSSQSEDSNTSLSGSADGMDVGLSPNLPAPTSQSSSRSNSPLMVEMFQNLRQNYFNMRSVSLYHQNLSPISSRSSSPRYLRSPSPLEYLENSMVSLPQDDSTDLVFYEDRYILRSHSPISTGSTDHQVPDVNMDFQQTVSDSEEFPSFRSYRHRRVQNSCQDQVVPDYIEE